MHEPDHDTLALLHNFARRVALGVVERRCAGPYAAGVAGRRRPLVDLLNAAQTLREHDDNHELLCLGYGLANSLNELAVLPVPHTALATTYALCPLPPAPLVGHEHVLDDLDRLAGGVWDATAEPDDVDELYRRHTELFGPPDGDAAVATSVKRLRATLREYVEFWTS